MANQKPVDEIRIGRVKATIWRNGTDEQPRHNVTFSRIYKEGDQWKSTQSFAGQRLDYPGDQPPDGGRPQDRTAGYRAPPDAENLEEIIVEALRLTLLVRCVGPFADEFGGARTNLVPGQAHGLKVFHV